MPVCATCGTSYGSTVRICVRDGTPLVTRRTDHQHLGTLLDGKYRIDSFITAGGMGSVYRAVHVMLDKTVAVKVIKNELVTSDEVVARFQREARAASNLNHPNIVSVYDLGQTPEGTLYIAMEFIDGPSLKEVIRRNGPLTPWDSIDILRQVASALSSAHRKQIVHRDLKSDNLMLASEGDRKVVKLVDFGIAKTFDESTQLTAAGYMLGTPHYMSPEQAAGRPVDHRADLYSLGVILYEMITGEVPFGDAAVTSVLVRLATEVPPIPSARRPDLRVLPALDAVAMRCLEKDPERRFQSADEFADALERALAEINSQPTMPRASIPTTEGTLVRPAAPRRFAALPADSGDRLPAARPPAGLDIAAWTSGRVAAVLLVLGAVAAAIVAGVGLSNDAPEEIRPSETIQRPVVLSVPPPATPAPAPVRPVSEANIPSNPASVRSSPPIDYGSGRVPAQDESASRPQAPSVGPPPLTSAPPQSGVTLGQTPPATAPVTAPAPVPAAPAQPARSAPSVSVTCQAFTDVCGEIRSELVRALQADAFPVVGNQAAADIEVTVNVALVSETPSTQFGTPITTRTYSVELTGSSRSTALVMPEPRIFGFDALFGRARLQENARLIAAGTVEAVRTFTAKGKF
jgi:serine/threonine-protein kinase